MSEYNRELESSFLIYLDANNLYGWAMSQTLPTGDFKWVDVGTNFNISNDAELGLILEVDLDYPNSLHDSHSDLPFCPERISVSSDSKITKLVPNLNNKKDMSYITQI